MRLLFALLFSASLLAACSTTQRVPEPPQDPVIADEIEEEPTPDPDVLSNSMATCESGRAGSYDCGNVDLMARVAPDVFGSERGNDIWGWTDPQTGVEYALVGLDDGTGFVSLATPSAPAVLGKLPTHTDPSIWRDIKVYRNHAYIVSEAKGHGMQVFDLTRLRGLAADPSRTFEADAHYGGVSNAHNVVINEDTGFAYIVGTTSVGEGLPAACASPGFHAVDLSNPASPQFSTCFSDAARDALPRTAPGYTHDAQCLVYNGPDEDYQGRELCFAANEDVLTVFDVADKADVRIVSMVSYPGASYSHQGWLTEDGRYFLLDDELDEISNVTPTQRTLIFDMMDLDEPEFMAVWDSGIPVIDHNQYILGDLSYQSNYKAGLRIVDVSGVATGDLREVAYFDTFPQGQDVQFGGQWSNFPYFESGIVIANDSQNGLFILRPTIPETGS